MAKKHFLPSGPFVDAESLTPQALAFLQTLAKPMAEVNEVSNLDGATSYSNDELRDKIIELIDALQS